MTPSRNPSATPAPGKTRKPVRCPLLDGDFEQWVPCCTRQFLPLVRLVAGDDDMVKDALQQSWAIVLDKLHQYQGGYPACGWVRAIVHNEALRRATTRSRDVRVPLDVVENEAVAASRRLRPASAVRDSPEAAAYIRELKCLLRELIDDLPPTFREVVRLRDLDDRSPQEVAQQLHISTRNVAVRLHRGHKLMLRAFLRRMKATAAVPARANSGTFRSTGGCGSRASPGAASALDWCWPREP